MSSPLNETIHLTVQSKMQRQHAEVILNDKLWKSILIFFYPINFQYPSYDIIYMDVSYDSQPLCFFIILMNMHANTHVNYYIQNHYPIDRNTNCKIDDLRPPMKRSKHALERKLIIKFSNREIRIFILRSKFYSSKRRSGKKKTGWN